MAYSDIALLSQDYDFYQRVSACYATEESVEPTEWARAHIWMISASPGFGDAYASALAGGVERPGNDPSVISDGQILASVQAITNNEAATDVPQP